MIYKESINHDIYVSVIIPIYNAENYLKKCLDSVICQTLRNIEIILIDDGSVDNSSQICKEYMRRDNRIIYYYKENEGLAAARQDGMERAHGEYIGFVDSDDWIEQNMFERMYSVAKQEGADVVFCGIYADDKEKNPVYLAPGVYDRNRIENEILPRSLAALTPKGANDVIRWSNWSRIYRTELIHSNGIAFDRRFRRSQDLQLTFETALVANCYVSICDVYLYHNRTTANGQSLSRGYTKNFWGLYRPLIDKLYQDVRGYKKQDLIDSMHLCTFFFAESGLRNELELSSLPRKEKIKKIDEIVKDPVLKDALQYVPYEKLNKSYQMYYHVLMEKSGKEAYILVKKMKFKNDYIMPIIRAILNNKFVEPMYKKIRKKGHK